MDDWQWRAWVGLPSGVKLGAAFLVTETRLLTCAHTVHGLDEVHVGFPGLLEDLPAKVVHRGDWRREGDTGDVAVLELHGPVPLRPARFAAPDEVPERADTGEFGVWGFPRRRDGGERHATVTTSPRWSREQEWWELRTKGSDALEEGYSGSPVYDTSTGEVIGMVTNAELHGGRGDLGWMLPLDAIRRHWEALDDLLPLRWLTPQARCELRELLDGARFTDPVGADLERIAGRPTLTRFTSVWSSVRYVAEGWPQDRLVRYLAALGRHLPEPRRQSLTAWSARHLPGAAAAVPDRCPDLASLIVRLERATFDNAYDVTVHTWIDGAEGPAWGPERVSEKQVRATVEEGVARLAPALFGREWMIEFAVPESWLGKPFEQWHLDPRNKIQMRKYPVVVRDVERLRPDSIRRDQAHHRWRLLTERGRSDPHPVACDAPRRGTAFQDWLEANADYCVLVYGSRPVKNWLTAALNNGIPVMLWPRTPCQAASHKDCRGHRVLDELTAAVVDKNPFELPRVALALRKEALLTPRDRPHCGRDLTLLWDDPSRLPDPPLAMEA
ncbi:MAG TPA: trypsin-like peptidase domain-containing protein [Spirillospora sp.]